MEGSFKKSMLWNAAGNVTYLLCQWLITVLVTVMGGLRDAGILSVAMSVSATVQTLAMFGIRSYQVSDMQGKYTDTCYVGLRTLTCGLAMLVCVIFSLAGGYRGSQLLAVVLFMLFRLAECYSDVLHGIAQKCGRLDIAGKAFLMKGVGILLCFLAGYWLTGMLNVGLLLMMLFSCASTLLYDLPAVRKLSVFHLFDRFRSCGRLAWETLPLCVYLFLSTAISTVPKLILEKQCGGEVMGAYSSVFAPAMLLQAATGYLYNPFATAFAQHCQEGDRRSFFRLLFRIILVILGIAAVVLFAAHFLGEFVLVLVFGEQIREYAYLLNPILIVNFVISYLGLFCMAVIVLRKFRLLLTGCGLGALLALVLTAPAIDRLGANGASYGLIAAGTAASLVLLAGILFCKWDAVPPRRAFRNGSPELCPDDSEKGA